MKQQIYAYVATFISLLVLDGLWLSLTMSRIYQKYLSHLMADRVTLWAVAAFYVLYAFGLYFIVVRMAHNIDLPLASICIAGFVFGMTAYATYDLTNQATLKNWPAFITIIDIVWGGAMSAVAACIGAWILRLIKST